MSDRDLGINYLRLWWNATPMSQLYLTNFQDAIAYYDSKNPDFIASLGNMAKSIDQTKVQQAFAALAQQYSDQYPPWTDFLQALVGAAGSVSAGDIASAAASGIGTSLKWLGGGLAIYVMILGGIAVVAFFPEIKDLLKDAKSKLKVKAA